ncbi:MAG: hypothetical protein IJU25_01990, partial [Lachnospiraceae bacterium]|nr:hypothetical protein [Lachnospiraceae bacterium]
CPFIISKATQGVGSNAMVDSTLESFIQGCEQNKIPYYLYVYLNVGNEKAQAEYLVSVCKPLVGSYFRGYALDIEAGNTASAVKEALDYIKTQSKKTLLYTNWSQYYTYKSVIDGRGADCAWWEARYGQNTGELSMLCHDEVDLHQYTSVGTCPGIGTGEVDMNRLTGTKPESWFTSP